MQAEPLAFTVWKPCMRNGAAHPPSQAVEAPRTQGRPPRWRLRISWQPGRVLEKTRSRLGQELVAPGSPGRPHAAQPRPPGPPAPGPRPRRRSPAPRRAGRGLPAWHGLRLLRSETPKRSTNTYGRERCDHNIAQFFAVTALNTLTDRTALFGSRSVRDAEQTVPRPQPPRRGTLPGRRGAAGSPTPLLQSFRLCSRDNHLLPSLSKEPYAL